MSHKISLTDAMNRIPILGRILQIVKAFRKRLLVFCWCMILLMITSVKTMKNTGTCRLWLIKSSNDILIYFARIQSTLSVNFARGTRRWPKAFWLWTWKQIFVNRGKEFGSYFVVALGVFVVVARGRDVSCSEIWDRCWPWWNCWDSFCWHYILVTHETVEVAIIRPFLIG